MCTSSRFETIIAATACLLTHVWLWGHPQHLLGGTGQTAAAAWLHVSLARNLKCESQVRWWCGAPVCCTLHPTLLLASGRTRPPHHLTGVPRQVCRPQHTSWWSVRASTWAVLGLTPAELCSTATQQRYVHDCPHSLRMQQLSIPSFWAHGRAPDQLHCRSGSLWT